MTFKINQPREVEVEYHSDKHAYVISFLFADKDDIVLDRKDIELEYEFRDLEDMIDDLIDWISEARYKQDRQSDRNQMLEDLEQLMAWDDELILSSTSTNEYLSETQTQAEYVWAINDIIEAYES